VIPLWEKLLARWTRLWASLGNTNRSGDYLTCKGESLAPIPSLQEYLISTADDHSEDRKIFSPLKGGYIRGTVAQPSEPPTVSDAVTSAARTVIIPAGQWGRILSIVETASAATVPYLLNADAAISVGNTLAVGSSLNNTRSTNPFTGLEFYGPIYATCSGGGTLRWSVQLYDQVNMG